MCVCTSGQAEKRERDHACVHVVNCYILKLYLFSLYSYTFSLILLPLLPKSVHSILTNQRNSLFSVEEKELPDLE